MTPFAKRQNFPLGGVKLFMGMPIGRVIEPETHFSVLKTVYALQDKKVPVIHSNIKGSSIIEMARSRVCEEFLKSKATHLFMLDSDQVWEPEGFMRILELATVLPVVGGVYPVKRDPPTFFVDREPGPPIWNTFGCVKLRGMGLGFTCVQRRVIEQLAEKAPRLKIPERDDPMPHIFRCDSADGVFRGEDMAFFADVRDLGYEVWVDPKVKVGHIGHKKFAGNFMEGY